MIALPTRAGALLRRRRPVLRVQLALLYSGVFVGLVVLLLLASSVLFGTANVFFGHSTSAYHPGMAASAAGVGTRSFRVGPFLLALLGIGIALLLAWWLAGRFLRPLRAMTAAAQEISATNLDRRLGLEGPEDELTGLGRTLDDLFARLQASFASQRQFVANASHELRTPIAGQRTLLQVALADPRADAETLRSACEEALQVSGEQERLIDALLSLAVSERGIERWEGCDLGGLAELVVSARRAEAERREVRIDTTLDAANVTGDPRLIESLVANLVENAIRHNVTGGRVEVTTGSGPDGARIVIENTGPVVPAGDLERLFRPFQRLAGERIGADGGHGLGLAVVQAIVTAHGATLAARPRPDGGLRIEVGFARGRDATAPGPVAGTDA